ncbi:MAG: thioredoxin family protein [bacterium]
MAQRLLVVTLVALLVLCSAAGRAAAKPPVFTDKVYSEAMAQAKAQSRFAIIKATAEWCPPCKQMDRTTWLDEGLIKWINDKGVAVYLDVDKEPGLAKELRVEAMPTIIVFKEGKEFDRVVGYQSAEQMMAWLGAIERGETRAGELQRRAGKRADKDGRVDVDARMDLARELAGSDKEEDLKAATEEYLWLWENMLEHEESMRGVRVSFMAGYMQHLAKKHAPALAAFTALRDETATRLKTSPEWEDLSDWIVLNTRVLEKNGEVLAWFDRIRGDADSYETVRRFADDILPLLVEAGRWKDAGEMLKQPQFYVADRLRMYARSKMFAGHEPESREYVERFSMTPLAQLHASLLAAGREEEAWKVVADVLSANDTPLTRTVFAEVALEAKVVSSKHVELVTSLAAKGVDAGLIERVKAAAK